MEFMAVVEYQKTASFDFIIKKICSITAKKIKMQAQHRKVQHTIFIFLLCVVGRNFYLKSKGKSTLWLSMSVSKSKPTYKNA